MQVVRRIEEEVSSRAMRRKSGEFGWCGEGWGEVTTGNIGYIKPSHRAPSPCSCVCSWYHNNCRLSTPDVNRRDHWIFATSKKA